MKTHVVLLTDVLARNILKTVITVTSNKIERTPIRRQNWCSRCKETNRRIEAHHVHYMLDEFGQEELGFLCDLCHRMTKRINEQLAKHAKGQGYPLHGRDWALLRIYVYEALLQAPQRWRFGSKHKVDWFVKRQYYKFMKIPGRNPVRSKRDEVAV